MESYHSERDWKKEREKETVRFLLLFILSEFSIWTFTANLHNSHFLTAWVLSKISSIFSRSNAQKPHTCITSPPREIWSYKLYLASGYSFQFRVPRASSTGSTTSKTHLMKKSGGLSDMCPRALMACQHQRPALFCVTRGRISRLQGLAACARPQGSL